MGPRFENRGFAGNATGMSRGMWLQWVHGSRTVVLGKQLAALIEWGLNASMGPRFENRGFVAPLNIAEGCLAASMGPRFENRGFASASLPLISPHLKALPAREWRSRERRRSALLNVIRVTPCAIGC